MKTNTNDDIAISIIVMTYNHEQYIKQALDSIFMQKINVKYEVIIHDDVSKDNTQRILKTYAAKYPDRIRLFLRKTKTKRVTYASCKLIKLSRGRYISFLEGDDYWTDENKLQKQYDFLEQHGEYVGVTHRNCIVNQNGTPIWNRDIFEYYNWHGEYTVNDYWYSNKLPGQTATLMCRNVFQEADISIIYKAHDMMGDVTLYLFLLTQGNIYRLEEEMSARRLVVKKGKDNWNSIALSRDVVREHIILQIKQLCWYETITKNYKTTKKRWKQEQKMVWDYIRDKGIRRGMFLFLVIVRARVANCFGCIKQKVKGIEK